MDHRCYHQQTIDTPLTVVIIYRQPSADPGAFITDIDQLLSTTHGHAHLILGDINIDYLDERVSETYQNTISLYNFTNTITIPTRLSKHKSSCLDHILSNSMENEAITGTIQCDISDHLPTFYIAVRNSQSNLPSSTNHIVRHILHDKLSRDLANENWNDILTSGDVDNDYDLFIQKLKSRIDNCTLERDVTKRPGRFKFTKLWITNFLLTKIKKKYNLHRQLSKFPLNTKLKSKYKRVKNELTSELRTAKYNYFKNLFNECSNSSETWKIINTQVLNKPVANTKRLPTKLEAFSNPSLILTTDSQIANELNSYFSNVGKALAQKIPPVNYACELEDYPEVFEFQQTSKPEVLATINSLKDKKAAGIDGISSKIIKLNAAELAAPLCNLINKSIVTQKVPLKMKVARINPLYKKGSPNRCENYRPISILPIFSKITEKIINSQIIKYLEESNILNPVQFGFRKNLGTSDALLSFTNKTLKAFNHGNCVLGIFIDFSKAFDTVDHNILLTKLKTIGFKRSAINWIKNYLSNRKQLTKINDSLSTASTITCGVPQGSVLGSTLFLVYVNDLTQKLKYLTPILYADDTNLFIESKNLNGSIDSINADLETLHNWCNLNKLTINLEKTNYIILKNPQNTFKFKEKSLKINGLPIEYSNDIKFLGIHLDSQMNWNRHISKVLKDFRPFAGLFYRMSQHLSRDILIILYNSFINSKLSYCLEAWGNAPSCYLSKIQVFQNKILRIMNRKAFDTSALPLYNKSKILNIQNLYKFKILIKAHKTFYRIKQDIAINHLITRQTFNNLKIPFYKSKAGQRSLNYQESALWNGLPSHLKHIQQTKLFKQDLKRYLLR